jgi:hypothetical protein
MGSKLDAEPVLGARVEAADAFLAPPTRLERRPSDLFEQFYRRAREADSIAVLYELSTLT